MNSYLKSILLIFGANQIYIRSYYFLWFFTFFLKNQMTEKIPRKLLSLIALIFFPFIVHLLLKWEQNDYELDKDDLLIIDSFKKAWYFVIFSTALSISLFVVSFYYSIDLLWNVNIFLMLTIIAYICYNVFRIFSNKQAILFSSAEIQDLNINKVESMNFEYILTYLPLLSTYKYFSKTYTKEQEYRVKESNFLYFIWWIVAFLAIFLNSLFMIFYIFLLFIIVRSISLFFWVDFMPDYVKKLIYESYEISPYELFAFFCASLSYIFVNLSRFIRSKRLVSYSKLLNHSKENLRHTYKLWSVLKNPKKYLFLFISYIVFILIMSYYIYFSLYSFAIFVHLFWIIILCSYFILNYYFNENTLLTIPILTPLVRFIIKKFN